MDGSNEKQGAIFLSHHSSQAELVAHLARYLEKKGLTTWYAPRNIRSGEEWDVAIDQAIKNCKAVVLLFCSQADASIQVKREISLADKFKKPVFWLRVENVEPQRLSYFLTSTQWLDWLDKRDDTLEKLVKDIYALDTVDNPQNGEDSSANNTVIPQKAAAVNNWARDVFAFSSDRDAAECAARVYFAMAEKYPDSSLVLPTGRSATMIFRAMTRLADSYDTTPFGEAHIISDTETFGVWREHETSRTKHINELLIEPLKKKNKAPPDEQLHLLSGVYTDDDPVKSAIKVLKLYPPSVHGVSLSPTGEILAYEVGTYSDIDEIIDDPPKIVEVTEHSKKYIDPNQPSKSILTIGLGTAMSARVLLLLAFDAKKASIVNRLFTGTTTAGVPATLLKNHKNAFLITTEAVCREAEIDFAKSGMSIEEAVKCITAD